ncbi:MAG TPA: hypothetical protein PK990_05120 [Salinivirgaceae bacterium]|nr:hypothetical protein [Salinivirgaceae bacterium]
MRRSTIFLCLLFLISFTTKAQKGDYELVAEFSPPHLDNSRLAKDKQYQLNSLKLSPSGKILLAEYGYKSSLVALYSLDSIKFIGAYWINEVTELEQAYFSPDEKILYVRNGRFSSEFVVIDIINRTLRKVLCDKTPNGCTPAEGGLNVIQIYSSDREFFCVRNAVDKRTLQIYKRKQP